MQPFFGVYKSNLERAFVQLLDASKEISWWFKNGERDSKFFAIPYEDGTQKPFYVDFIVQFKDGLIGIFDTKVGYTQQIAGPKIDGLFRYIRSQNRNGKKLTK